MPKPASSPGLRITRVWQTCGERNTPVLWGYMGGALRNLFYIVLRYRFPDGADHSQLILVAHFMSKRPVTNYENKIR
jgi:hypothetical protein